jgi:hypothetical protein
MKLIKSLLKNNFMSVRAYKLIKIETASEPTFNCWHDSGILDYVYGDDDRGNGGLIQFERETIEELAKDKEAEKELREVAKAILADFKKGDDFIEYYCY